MGEYTSMDTGQSQVVSFRRGRIFSPSNSPRKLRRFSSVNAFITQRHTIRGRLHGEFQPGLKFQPAHRDKILLRLHG